MAFDAYFLTAVLREMEEQILDSRVEKIHQPARDSVILLLKGRQGRHKLLISPNPAAPRLHLTALSPENPPQPPMFCMLLRKHLSGSRLVSVSQQPMERCVRFTFDCIDELGDRCEKHLVAELMGRTCNLYLLGPDQRILDCLRRIGLDESSRPALPGLYYAPPAPLEKRDPAAMEEADWQEFLAEAGDDVLHRRLMDKCGGLSPLVCREAALFAAGEVEARVAHADGEKLYLFFREHLRFPAPYHTEKQFAFCPIRQAGECSRAESFSALLDHFYSKATRSDALRQKAQSLRKTVQNLCQRLKRKLALQEKELAATLDRERLRQLGDIVTANLHAITKGQAELLAEDFYDEEMKLISIPLSPLLSPQENAAKLYKDYNRMKHAQKELTKQLELGAAELEYLQSVLEELERADSEAELEEIRQELQQQGYVRQESGKKRPKQAKLAPMRFESTDGFAIFVGRNNRQNDELTFKLARKDDLWLHASKRHGSHVIIACAGRPVPDDTVTEAAALAAWYAETSGSKNVPVDVTQVRQVKKPPAAKPGMVIYHTYRTVVVKNPAPEIVLPEY